MCERLKRAVPTVVFFYKEQNQPPPHLKEEEVLGNFLDQFFFYFLWEELGQEMKCYGRVLWNFLIQDLRYQKKNSSMRQDPTR